MKLALLLLTVVALTDLVSGDQVELLRLICANDKKVELTRASQLADLAHISSAQQEEAACSQRVLAAIVELDQLVNSDNDNVCSPAKIKHIRSYYAKYVDKKSLKRDNEAKLPKALKKLFLSFGFGVSRVCKSSMISSLMSDARSLLNEQDFDQIVGWTSDSSPLSKMIKNPKDVDDLVLPQEIVRLFTDKKDPSSTCGYSGTLNSEKLLVVLQPTASKTVRRIQILCSRRFRPIYEQWILPLVSLSRLGLSYKADEHSAHLEEIRTNREVHLWYRIVYLCESVRNLEVFQESDQMDKGTVRILTSNEAEELRASQPTDEPESGIGDQIVYYNNVEHKLDDLIVNDQDKYMGKLVSKFEVNKSELGRIRSKIIRQVVSFAKQFLKTGKVNIVKGLLKKGAASNMNEILIKAIDEYASTTDDIFEREVRCINGISRPGELKRVRRSSEAGAGLPMIILLLCVGLVVAPIILLG